MQTQLEIFLHEFNKLNHRANPALEIFEAVYLEGQPRPLAKLRLEGYLIKSCAYLEQSPLHGLGIDTRLVETPATAMQGIDHTDVRSTVSDMAGTESDCSTASQST